MSAKAKMKATKKQAASAKAKPAAAKKQAAKKQAAKKQTAKQKFAEKMEQVEQAASAALLKEKEKRTKVEITKTKVLEIGELTEENLRRHNFKYCPRRRLSSALPSFSSVWAESTISLKFMKPTKF